MTGLNPDHDTVISISCSVTNANLDLLDEKGFDVIIHHDAATLSKMDPWCVKTHGDSGLTAAAIASKTTAQQAADGLLEYVQLYVPERRKALLAGNSVHFDKRFLVKGPYAKVMDHLLYRIFDVSAIKEAAMRWAPDNLLIRVPPKQGLHQAREDVLESIEEARYYRDTFFKFR